MEYLKKIKKLNDKQMDMAIVLDKATMTSHFLQLSSMASLELVQAADWSIIFRDMLDLEVALLEASIRLRLAAEAIFGKDMFQRAFLICALSMRVGSKGKDWDRAGNQEIVKKAKDALEDFEVALGNKYKQQKTIVNITMAAFPEVCMYLLVVWNWAPTVFTNTQTSCQIFKYIFSTGFLRIMPTTTENTKLALENQKFFYDLLTKREAEIKLTNKSFAGFYLQDPVEVVNRALSRPITKGIVFFNSELSGDLKLTAGGYVIAKSLENLKEFNEYVEDTTDRSLKYQNQKEFDKSKVQIKEERRVKDQMIENSKMARDQSNMRRDVLRAAKEGAIEKAKNVPLDSLIELGAPPVPKVVLPNKAQASEFMGTRPNVTNSIAELQAAEDESSGKKSKRSKSAAERNEELEE